MEKRDRVKLLNYHGWDIITNLDSVYSAEKEGVILKNKSIEKLYFMCREYDYKNIIYKMEEGTPLNDWEQILYLKNIKRN